MPFVICDKCSGYYELEEEEAPDDFEACQCGGSLNYFENMDDYDANKKRNHKTTKSEQYSNIGVYEDIQRDKTFSYLEKRDIPMDSSISQNLVINSAFIILSFTIFPLELGVSFSYFPFYIMAAFAIILPVTLFYLQNANKINTIGEMRKFYGICGAYFILFLLILIVWIATNLVTFVFSLIGNFVIFGFIFFYSSLFFQKFMGNYVNREILDPLDSMDMIKKYIYYAGVFISVAWFMFVIVAVLML